MVSMPLFTIKSGMQYHFFDLIHSRGQNVYAYLKGDVAKVSRDTARRIMDFATSAAGR